LALTEAEHPVEFLPELALGVLAEDDAPGIREHIASCESCRAEYEVMVRAARLLPYAVEEVEPATEVREGLMERIAAEPRLLRARGVRPSWQRFTAIAAGVAVLLAAGGVAGALLWRGNDNAGLEDEVGHQRELVQAVAQGTAARDTAEQGGTKATLVYAPGTDSAFAWLEGMPPLPEGKAYQAWFIAADAPKPSNVFSSTSGGVWLDSPGSVRDFSAFALTIEDKDGATAPSQQPFVVVALNTAAAQLHPFTMDDWLAMVRIASD
jgi:hypothetical protein